MKIHKPGHLYELENHESSSEQNQMLQFIEKVPVVTENEVKLQTIKNGTTNEDVLKVLINRMNYLQAKLSCRENAIAITKLEEALLWLEKRTNERIQRGIEGKHTN